jgi:hypothetical protein
MVNPAKFLTVPHFLHHLLFFNVWIRGFAPQYNGVLLVLPWGLTFERRCDFSYVYNGVGCICTPTVFSNFMVVKS